MTMSDGMMLLVATLSVVTMWGALVAARDEDRGSHDNCLTFDLLRAIATWAGATLAIAVACVIDPGFGARPLLPDRLYTVAPVTTMLACAPLLGAMTFVLHRLQCHRGTHTWQRIHAAPLATAALREAAQAVAATVPTSTTRPVVRPPRPGTASRILLVEDSRDTREALATALRAHGHDVATAGDGVDALAQLRAGLDVDVIILDLRMPGMDGFEFRTCQLADPRLATIRTIVLSAQPDLRTAVTSAPFVMEFYEKPIGVGALLATLSAPTARGRGGV